MYVIEVRRLINNAVLYLGRDGQLNCRAIEEARVYKTSSGATTAAAAIRGSVVPVYVGQRTKSRGVYAKAREQK